MNVIPRRMMMTSLLHPNGYTVYFKTRHSPKDPYSYVNICVINKEGFAFCHRFHPLLTSERNRIVFQSYEFGEIDSVFVAPESGVWDIDSVVIESLSDVHTFIPDYGFDDHNVRFVPKKWVDAAVYQRGMSDYEQFKNDILLYATAYGISGSSIIALLRTPTEAIAFSVGCMLGMVYQRLLHHEIDNIGKDEVNANALVHAYKTLNGLVLRMFVFSAVIYTTIQANQEFNDPYMGMIIALGFLTNKAALLHVAMTKNTSS